MRSAKGSVDKNKANKTREEKKKSHDRRNAAMTLKSPAANAFFMRVNEKFGIEIKMVEKKKEKTQNVQLYVFSSTFKSCHKNDERIG